MAERKVVMMVEMRVVMMVERKAAPRVGLWDLK